MGMPNSEGYRGRVLALLMPLLVALPAAARAQEADAEAPDAWRVLLDIAYSGSSGNQNLSFIDAGMGVTRLETDVAEFELTARARSGTDDGVRVAESYRASLQADAFPMAHWSPFVFGSAERDRFKQLDLRTNAGGGIKYTFLREEHSEVSLSLAVLHSREDFRIAEEPTRSDGRFSWRFKGGHQLGEEVRVQNVSFYQPVWDAPGDYLVQSESVLSVQVFSMLAVAGSYVYQRDSTPPADVLPEDHHVKLGVQLQL